ncbi:MAG: TonB-dependent receptor [Bacteroidota bacterium]
MKRIIFLLSCLYMLSAYSQDTLVGIVTDSVVIRATRIRGFQHSIPRAINLISEAQFQEGQQQLSLTESLVGVPGLLASNGENFAQDVRLSIRGFGARAPFGIRGIKLVVDGFIFSTPDGQGQLDNVDPGILSRGEVLRGASSGLYGNAAGGVVSLTTASPEEGFQLNGGLALGGFGFQRYQMRASYAGENLSQLYYGARTVNQGYRAHSQVQNDFFHGRWSYTLKPFHTITLIANYLNSPLAQDPGGLTLDEVEENRRQARGRNVDFGVGESVSQGMIGLKSTKLWYPSPNSIHVVHGLSARLQVTQRDFSNFLPFQFGGAVAFDRLFGGGGIDYEFKKSGVWGYYMLTAGLDVDLQQDDRQRFMNMNGERGDLTLDQKESFSDVGVFLLQSLSPISTRSLTLDLGIRWDRLGIGLEDQFLADEDQSAQLSYTQWSPSGGISYKWLDGREDVYTEHYVYAHSSVSFETPTLTELSNNPSGLGGFNPEIQPQTAQNLEGGFKGRIGNGFQYQAVGYLIFLENELVPYELADFPGRTFYRNAGASRRTGLEVNGNYLWTPNLRTEVAYAYAVYRYRSYIADGENLEGNELPGLPNHQGYVAVIYQKEEGFFGRAWLQHRGQVFADDANAVEIAPYTIINLRLGWNFLREKWDAQPYVGVNNLTNTPYFANIRINAFGGRYYEPAGGRHLFIGVKVQFHK